jgi:hypothetical protein
MLKCSCELFPQQSIYPRSKGPLIMATAARAAHYITRIEDPTLEEIRNVAAEIRQNWSAKEQHRRRTQALAAQQRLLGLALSAAA